MEKDGSKDQPDSQIFNNEGADHSSQRHDEEMQAVDIARIEKVYR